MIAGNSGIIFVSLPLGRQCDNQEIALMIIMSKALCPMPAQESDSHDAGL
jgi:hypothetical protein